MSTTQDAQSTFKLNLTCIFLSGRARYFLSKPNGWPCMAAGIFFLCSPNCPKQPRTSFPFYIFFYPTISGRISAFSAWLFQGCKNTPISYIFGGNRKSWKFCIHEFLKPLRIWAHLDSFYFHCFIGEFKILAKTINTFFEFFPLVSTTKMKVV